MFKKGFLSFEWASSSNDIRYLRRHGKLIKGKNFFVRILHRRFGEKDFVPKISVLCAKGFKNSVRRNSAKRRTIGCIMDNRSLLNTNNSYLIECRRGSEKRNYQELVMEIEKLLRSHN